MQNRLAAAAANQVTVNYRDVRCLKDKVVIQKVQTLPRTEDLYQTQEYREVRSLLDKWLCY